MTDLIEKLRLVKNQADSAEQDRQNYQAYIADRVERGGWTKSDVAEYRAEVAKIMAGDDDDAKRAAREFWALKRTGKSSGINHRIKQAIDLAKQEAA